MNLALAALTAFAVTAPAGHWTADQAQAMLAKTQEIRARAPQWRAQRTGRLFLP